MIAAFLIFEAQGSLRGEVVSTKNITERIGKGGFEKLRGLKGEGVRSNSSLLTLSKVSVMGTTTK